MRMINDQGQRVYYNIVTKHGKDRAVILAIGDNMIIGRDKQKTKSRTFRTQDKAEQWLKRHGYKVD